MWRRCKSRHTKYPSQTHLPRITLFAICLSFSSPPLHPCRFIRPLFPNLLSRSLAFCVLVAMASPPIIVNTLDHQVLDFKQRDGESLKDALHRICNAQNRSTRKQSTSVLCNFYVGITPWDRYILDTIIGGNFLGSHTFDAYNSMLDLFGPPPLLVNGTVLTLEHVMQRLEIIKNKVATIELIENLDKKIHNQITHYGSRVGVTSEFFK